MGCDSGLYNGKSQPGSAALPAAGAVAPEEGFPEMGEILSGDGEPVIADRKAGPAGFPGQGKANLTASGAVAQGVGEEIPHHFPEPFPVAGEREFRQISGQADLWVRRTASGVFSSCAAARVNSRSRRSCPAS